MSTNGASTALAATVARNLKAARLAAGYTQHSLAVALGRGDAMTVSRWERCEHMPSSENLTALAEVLNVPVAAFFYEPDKAAA